MKYFYAFFLVCTTLLIIRLNQLLYVQPPSEASEQISIIKQLNFLESELKEHSLGQRMQALYPEGYVFIYALYGLAWSELAAGKTLAADDKKRALEEATMAYNSIDSPSGKGPFSQSLSPKYGIYYQGWRNYLLARILATQISFEGRAKLVLRFKSQCRVISEALAHADTPFLASYPGMAWPADSFLAMASLSIHDQLLTPEYEQVIKVWLKKTKALLDPETGMIPHKTNAENGSTDLSARGGSMALMLRLLVEIDPEMAHEQYQLFRQNYRSTALGLPMVREYPKGVYGLGDIDSGPVILGTGFAATIVSIGTYRIFGDEVLSRQQYQVVHAFGLSQTSEDHQSYLLGLLPMADAFIAWSRASPQRFPSTNEEIHSTWRLAFHGWSIFIILLMILPLYRSRLRRFYLHLKSKNTGK